MKKLFLTIISSMIFVNLGADTKGISTFEYPSHEAIKKHIQNMQEEVENLHDFPTDEEYIEFLMENNKQIIFYLKYIRGIENVEEMTREAIKKFLEREKSE